MHQHIIVISENLKSKGSWLTCISELGREVGLVNGTAESDASGARASRGRGDSEGGQGGDDSEHGELHVGDRFMVLGWWLVWSKRLTQVFAGWRVHGEWKREGNGRASLYTSWENPFSSLGPLELFLWSRLGRLRIEACNLLLWR